MRTHYEHTEKFILNVKVVCNLLHMQGVLGLCKWRQREDWDVGMREAVILYRIIVVKLLLTMYLKTNTQY